MHGMRGKPARLPCQLHFRSRFPWSVLSRSIDNAISARWLELAPNSSPWPCDAAGTAGVKLKEPETAAAKGVAEPKGAFIASADLQPHELQNLAEALPEIMKAAAGSALRFHLRIVLDDEGNGILPEPMSSLNESLESVNPNLRFKR